jgi:hypothetical protein
LEVQVVSRFFRLRIFFVTAFSLAILFVGLFSLAASPSEINSASSVQTSQGATVPSSDLALSGVSDNASSVQEPIQGSVESEAATSDTGSVNETSDVAIVPSGEVASSEVSGNLSSVQGSLPKAVESESANDEAAPINQTSEAATVPSGKVPSSDVSNNASSVHESISEAVESKAASDETAPVNETSKAATVSSGELASSDVSDNASIAQEVIPEPVEVNEATSSSAWPVTTDSLLIFLIGLSFVALVVSIWVNVFLLKWRRAAGEDALSIVPSELLKLVEKQTSASKELAIQQSKNFKHFHGELLAHSGKVIQEAGEARSISEEVLSAFTGLQKALNQKDAEIERLRGGYDSEVFRRFLSRFLKLEKTVGEDIEDLKPDDTNTLETLTDIQTLLKDALAECGLEPFSPELGVNIRDTVGVEDSKQRPAEHAAQILSIAEVIESGWRMKTPEGFDYLKKARVVVYVEAAPVEEAV